MSHKVKFCPKGMSIQSTYFHPLKLGYLVQDSANVFSIAVGERVHNAFLIQMFLCGWTVDYQENGLEVDHVKHGGSLIHEA